MQVFISHSHKNIDVYQQVCRELEKEGISYWNGVTYACLKDLNDQIKDAINNSDICVFIATKDSVESKYCHAETSYFWATEGKRLIVYTPSHSFNSTEIPEHLPEHLRERPRTAKLTDVIRELREFKEKKSMEERKRKQYLERKLEVRYAITCPRENSDTGLISKLVLDNWQTWNNPNDRLFKHERTYYDSIFYLEVLIDGQMTQCFPKVNQKIPKPIPSQPKSQPDFMGWIIAPKPKKPKTFTCDVYINSHRRPNGTIYLTIEVGPPGYLDDVPKLRYGFEF